MPACKGDLAYDAEAPTLTCLAAGCATSRRRHPGDAGRRRPRSSEGPVCASAIRRSLSCLLRGRLLALLADSCRRGPLSVRSTPGRARVQLTVDVPAARVFDDPASSGGRVDIEGYDPRLPGEPALPVASDHGRGPARGRGGVRFGSRVGSAERDARDVAIAATPGSSAAPRTGRWTPAPESAVSAAPAGGPAGCSTSPGCATSAWRGWCSSHASTRPARAEARSRHAHAISESTVEPAAGSLRGARRAGRPVREPVSRAAHQLRAGESLASAAAVRRCSASSEVVPGPSRRRHDATPRCSRAAPGSSSRFPTAGFHKIKFGQVRNLALFDGDTSTPIDSLRLFTWPGVPVLPEDQLLRLVRISRGGDRGRRRRRRPDLDDNADAIYFFGLGPSDCTDVFDAAAPDSIFLNHPYETRNYYFLTVSTAERPVPGKFRRIATASGAVVPDGTRSRPPRFEPAAISRDGPRVPAGPDACSSLRRQHRHPVFWEKWFWAASRQQLLVRGSVAPGGGATQLGAVQRPGSGGSRRRTPAKARSTRPIIWCDIQLPNGGRWNGLCRYRRQHRYGLSDGGNTVGTNVRIRSRICRSARPASTSRGGVVRALYQRNFEPVGNELAFDSPAGG